MEVRVAVESDVDRMMEVYADGRTALGALGIDQWQDGYPQRWLVEGDVERGESRVACDDAGAVVGCATVMTSGDRDYDTISGAWLTASTSDDPSYAAIHRVATAAESRGRGVAKALFAEAERIARERGLESLRVDTHPGNVPMQRLIEACGFSRCGTVVVSSVVSTSPFRIAYEKLVRA